MTKVIITCAVCGAETTRDDNPNLPLTPEEIAESAYEAYEQGASILHLHVRDENGGPTQDKEVFKKAIECVRAKCNMVIEVTTGGAVGMTLEERIQPVELDPEMASLDCGTVNFGDEFFANTLPMIREAASLMKSRGIRPTLECFDISHVDTAKLMIKEGLVEPPFHFGLVLNVPGALRYDSQALGFFVQRLPKDAMFTVMGIGGRASLQSVYGALAFGGHIRQGLEDNIYYSKGVVAESNAQLVERAARVAKEMGCSIAAPDDVREMLAL